MISGYEFSVGADGFPVDEISFNFEEVEVDYISPSNGNESMFPYRRDDGR